MTPDLYRRASELFNDLRELPDVSLADALDSACGSDTELRAQVARLLQDDRRANGGRFLDRRAIEDAARLVSPEAGKLPAAGTVIGNYRLGGRVGAGGMGVVYEAEDLRLHRRVAIKILPPSLATEGEERIRRFQREARAASLLSHPHIVTIFDADFDQSCYYIAMEFVEGKTLRQIISQDSAAVDTETILDLVGQTASALSAAHQASIVHRDVKPENIMVRPDGLVKVLDFGLARLEEGAGIRPRGPELSTRPGHLAGTIQYVSPEQVRGRPADPRSDIFSLGVVAFELATGVRPFDGPTDGSVFDAILNRTPPPPSSLRPALGTRLDGMILQMLEKDPELRFQTASDLRSCCKRLARDSTAFSPVPVPGPAAAARKRLIKIAIGVAFLTLLVACGWLYVSLRTVRKPPLTTRLTAFSGSQLGPALSPDGRELAFVWDGGGDNFDIYVKGVHEETPRRLTSNPAEDLNPAWSPDSNRIAFVRIWPTKKEILEVPAEGGPERSIAEIKPLFVPWSDRPATMPSTAGPSWSPDGQWLAVSDRCSDAASSDCVFLLSTDGSKRKRITTGAVMGDYCPVFSPDGKRIAFLRTVTDASIAEIYTQALDGSTPRRITSDSGIIWSIAWSSEGRIFYVSKRTGNARAWSVAADGGVPQPLPDTGSDVFSVAAAARVPQIALAQSYRNSNIWRTNLHAPSSQPALLIGSWRRNDSAQYSPDGSRIVFISTRSGIEEVWIANADGSGERRVTFASAARPIGSPSFSPDGKQLVYDTAIGPHGQICVMNVDGTNQRQFTTDPWHSMMPSWSRDGRYIYYIVGREQTRSLWKKPVDGGRPIHIADDAFSDALESSDGKRVFFTGAKPGPLSRNTPGIWEASSDGGDARLVPELAGVVDSRHFSVTHRGIYFLADEFQPWQIRFFDFATRRISPVLDIPRKPELFTHSLAVSPDGKWMLYTQVDQVGSEITMLSNPQ